MWGVCGRRSPLPQAGLDRFAVGEEEATALLASARVHRGRLVLLVDDAEQFADNDQAFAGLLAARTTDLLVVAAGRSDDLGPCTGTGPRPSASPGAGCCCSRTSTSTASCSA